MAHGLLASDIVNSDLVIGRPLPVGNQEQYLNQGYTNVYINNFGEDFDTKRLLRVSETFGKIVSAVVLSDDDGKCQGLGFIKFDTHDAATLAVEGINGSVINGSPIYCAKVHLMATQKQCVSSGRGAQPQQQKQSLQQQQPRQQQLWQRQPQQQQPLQPQQLGQTQQPWQPQQPGQPKQQQPLQQPW